MFRFNNLSKFKKEIEHFISDRKGGVSPAPYDSLNIGFNTQDDRKYVLRNRKALLEKVGIKLRALTTAKQTHSNNVYLVSPFQRGLGSKDYESAISDTDSLITRSPDILLLVQVADCVPLLIYDPKMKVIAAVHAGWKGTIAKIAEKTVKKMQEEFGSNPKDLVIGIGPSIGPCCYEVGDEVIGNAGDMKKFIDKKNKFDLWKANEFQLTSVRVKRSNIEISGICTKDNSGKYFSARASNGMTGRFGAGIMLRANS